MIEALISNSVVTGGLLLMVTGAAMAIFRGAPYLFWAWLKRRCSVTLDITDDEPVFHWIIAWLDQHSYTNKTRLLSVSAIDDEDEEPTVIFSPAPGNHLLTYRGRLVWVSRSREKATSGWNRRYTETLKLRILSRSQELVRHLVQDAIRYHKTLGASKPKAFVSHGGYWRRQFGFSPRPLASVILPDGQIEGLLTDIRWFLASREFYHSLGIPYRRGYLLHGIPGTGKTSLVSALASTLKLPLYVMSLSLPSLTDVGMLDLMMSVSSRSIVLIEDVDAVSLINRDNKPKEEGKESPADTSCMTLSGLLNSIDGVIGKEGCLLFMTTNHRDRLDPALIRPGRVDRQFEFAYATPSQVRRFSERFGINLKSDKKVTMAEIQQMLLSEVSARQAS